MYKKSRFNVECEKEGESFLYNSHTGAFLKFDKKSKWYFLRILKGFKVPQKYQNDFLRAGFIVSKDKDELDYYKNNYTKYRNSHLHLAIQTTLDCNFRCPDCYIHKSHNEYSKGLKEEEVKKFIDMNILSKSSMSVTWYGGEPLLNKKLMDNISNYIINKCKKQNITYEATIITNGYLLNREMAEFLSKDCYVNQAIITVDGGEITHNSKRILRSGRGSFQKIINNIKEVKDLIAITIRVNISKETINETFKLLSILMSEGLNGKVQIFFSQLNFNTEACQSVNEINLCENEYLLLEKKIISYARKKYFFLGDLIFFNRKQNPFQVMNSSSFIISYVGDIFKSWSEVGNRNFRVGTVSEVITSQTHLLKMNDRNLPTKCKNCSILPLCKGECRELSFEKSSYECDLLGQSIKDRIFSYYLKEIIETKAANQISRESLLNYNKE